MQQDAPAWHKYDYQLTDAMQIKLTTDLVFADMQVNAANPLHSYCGSGRSLGSSHDRSAILTGM